MSILKYNNLYTFNADILYWGNSIGLAQKRVELNIIAKLCVTYWLLKGHWQCLSELWHFVTIECVDNGIPPAQSFWQVVAKFWSRSYTVVESNRNKELWLKEVERNSRTNFLCPDLEWFLLTDVSCSSYVHKIIIYLSRWRLQVRQLHWRITTIKIIVFTPIYNTLLWAEKQNNSSWFSRQLQGVNDR